MTLNELIQEQVSEFHWKWDSEWVTPDSVDKREAISFLALYMKKAVEAHWEAIETGMDSAAMSSHLASKAHAAFMGSEEHDVATCNPALFPCDSDKCPCKCHTIQQEGGESYEMPGFGAVMDLLESLTVHKGHIGEPIAGDWNKTSDIILGLVKEEIMPMGHTESAEILPGFCKEKPACFHSNDYLLGCDCPCHQSSPSA